MLFNNRKSDLRGIRFHESLDDMDNSAADREVLRTLLEELGAHVLATFRARRAAFTTSQMATVSHEVMADTIYRIDREIEEALVVWLDAHWPEDWPVVLVMEGLDDPVIYPRTAECAPQATLIIDPIDGTREIMWDRRSAWLLAALAPFPANGKARLRDIEIAVMVELPTTRHRGSYRLSARRGAGVRGGFFDFAREVEEPGLPTPFEGTSLEHGFAGLFSPGPEAKEAVGSLVERLLSAYTNKPVAGLPVFDDQYISTGGQFFDLMSGRLRLYGDLRPSFMQPVPGQPQFVCHPYDVCTALIAQEAGCVIESPDGTPLDPLLDTTSAVAWMGYANADIAARARPIMQTLLERVKRGG